MANRYLHGFHDEGGEHLHGSKPGWTVITEETGSDPNIKGRDYSHLSNRGIGVIVRINHSHGGQGTIPLPTQYGNFALSVASFAASSRGVWGWIVGNEPNVEWERPQGVVITAQEYARCFLMCRDALMQASPNSLVGPAALAPYHANPTNWLDYAHAMYRIIGLNGGCGFIPLHAYSRSMNPGEIASTEKMGPPLQDQYKGFRTFEDVLEKALPVVLTSLPVVITEFDPNGPWLNENTGIIQGAYDYLDMRNGIPGTQKVIGMTCFRWLGPPQVNNVKDWEMRNKPKLLEDFRSAVERGFMSPTITGEKAKLVETNLPAVKKEEPTVNMSPIRQLTPRFLKRNRSEIDFADPSPGQAYYALVKADYYPPPEGARTFGPDHHLLVEVLNEDGSRAMGTPVHFTAGGASVKKVVDKQGGAYGVDEAMFSPGYGYGVYVGDDERLSDFPQGMGLGTIEQPDWNHHVTYHLVFQRKVAQVSQPSQPTPSQPPAQVPTLAHPIQDPSKRTVSQRFGDNPDDYARFGMAGHTGLDFAVPVGTVVVAVDTGVVQEAGELPDYGLYIKVRHSWGESVYAHLSQLQVRHGEPVGKGEPIALSGNSGNSTGPHLHFALRTNPYRRGAPYDGYRDPSPFLQSVSGGPTPVERPTSPTSPIEVSTIVRIIREAAQMFGGDADLLLSLIHAESSLNPLQINPLSGAKGLGQIMPATWSDVAPKVGATNIFDARDNARATAYYLEWSIDQMGGNLRQGLWAYIMGPTGAKSAIAKNAIPLEVQHYATKIIHGMEVIKWSRL